MSAGGRNGGSGAGLRILVTGASGFVGSHLLPELSRRAPEAEIFALYAQRIASGPETAVTPVVCDVSDGVAVEAAIAQIAPDRVLHLAAIATIAEAGRAPIRAWEINLLGAIRLAAAVRDRVPHCRFVFAGTGEAYGASFNAARGSLNEASPFAPLNVYAATKAAADLALGQMAAEGFEVVRTRPFNHTGPGQPEGFVVPTFAAQIARIEAGLQAPVVRVGNLEAERDFLDVADVVDAYLRLLLRDEPFEPGLALNLASGAPRRIGDVLADLLALSDVEVTIQPDPDRLRPSEIPRAVGDAARARAAIGWTPQIPWTQTLRAVLDHWRNKSSLRG